MHTYVPVTCTRQRALTDCTSIYVRAMRDVSRRYMYRLPLVRTARTKENESNKCSVIALHLLYKLTRINDLSIIPTSEVVVRSSSQINNITSEKSFAILLNDHTKEHYDSRNSPKNRRVFFVNPRFLRTISRKDWSSVKLLRP